KLLAVPVGALMLLSAACSDDGGSSKAASTTNAGPPPATSATTATSGGSAATAAPTATTTAAVDGRAFTVMVIDDFTNLVSVDLQGTYPMAQAVFKDMPGVKVTKCDSKGDANGSQACQRQAVDAKVAAVITSFSALAQDQTVLTKAGIPVLGNTVNNAPTAFGLTSSLGAFGGLGVGLGNAGCKKVGIIYIDGTDFLQDMTTKGVQLSGGTVAAKASTPVNAPDLAPAIAKLNGAGVDCMSLSLAPPMVVQAMTAINQSGKKVKVVTVSAIMTPKIRDSLGSLANGITVTDTQLVPDDTAPGIDEMRSLVGQAKMSAYSTFVWASAKVIKAALPAVQGDVTSASLLPALNGVRNVDLGGVLHTFSAIPLDNPAFSRWFNHYGVNYVIQNGKFVRQGADFYDIGPAVK
ncbi:MAG: putative substrate-binding transporter protein component, partial [Acidimicrobiia bacterium]|nr:putative substrate-binding transporter protein component [Acidimicrobiia bacterium]